MSELMSNPKLKELVEQFVKTKKVLILDSSATTRSQLTKLVAELGVNRNHIISLGNVQEAKSVLKTEKIQIVLSEFAIDKTNCLPIFQDLVEQYSEQERLLVLVTKNSQQSSVAQAMEGQIDSYILKPFVYNYIKENLFKAILTKTNPTSYQKKIQEASIHMAKKSFYLAEPILVDAIKMNPKPTMALYMYGELFFLRGDIQKAESFYQKALEIMPGHFKSLIKLYEIYFEGGRKEEAITLLETIRSMLPLSPQRLVEMFELYADTGKEHKMFDILEDYRDLDSKSPEMIDCVVRSLMKAGESFTRQDRLDLAHEAFYTAIGFSGFLFKNIETVVRFLITEGKYKISEFILSKSTPDDRSSPEFMNLEFLINRHQIGDSYVIARARDLIKAGVADINVYLEYIAVNLKFEKLTVAEQSLLDARNKFPDYAELWGEINKRIEAGVKEILIPSNLDAFYQGDQALAA